MQAQARLARHKGSVAQRPRGGIRFHSPLILAVFPVPFVAFLLGVSHHASLALSPRIMFWMGRSILAFGFRCCFYVFSVASYALVVFFPFFLDSGRLRPCNACVPSIVS